MDAFVLLMLVVSLLLNVYQAQRIRSLKWLVAPGPLATGTRLPTFQALTATEMPFEIRHDANAEPLLLCVYSPRCGWCKRNAANIRVVAAAASHRYRLVALTLTESGAEAALGVSGDFVAVHGASAETTTAYHLASTPATYVVDPSGRVERHWLGAYTGALAKEVESYFSIRLPGLTTQ